MMRWVLSGGMILGLCGLSQGGDWPGWLGPKRDNHAPVSLKPWSEPLTVAWRVPVGEGHGGPIAADGKVFLHYKIRDAEKEEVLCLDAQTGTERWRQSYDRPPFVNQFGNGPRSTPLWHDGRLYTLGVTGLVTAWDAHSGHRFWQTDLLAQLQAKNLFFGISTSPLMVDGQLIVMVGGAGCCLVALDPQTGRITRQTGDDAASYSSPVAWSCDGAGKQILLLTAAGLHGFEPRSLKSLWFVPFKDRLNESSSTPVWFANRLFISSVTAGMLAIDIAAPKGDAAWEPKVSWKNPALSCYFGTPVGFNQHLYVVTGSLPPLASANLHCVDPDTGQVLWTKRKVGTYHATLMRTREHLLMLEETGDLVLIQPDPKEYRELCRGKVCRNTWAHPALAQGQLFLRDGQELLAVTLPTAGR